MMLKIIAGLAVLAAVPATAAPHYSVVGQYRGADGGWDLLSVDPDTHRLYVARGDGVMALDLDTDESVDSLVPAQRAHSALAIRNTGEVIVTNGSADTAVIIDGATGAVRATIATGKRPDGAAWDPATNTVWVMNPGDGSITVIDPASARAVATVPVGGSLEFGAPDGKGKLYVTVEDKNEVAVIDTIKRTLIARYPLTGCDGPTGIVYLAGPKETVSACGNGVADVLGADGHQVASVAIGQHPDGAAYDGRRKVILIPSGSEGMLYVLSADAVPAVLQKVPTAKSARTIALDPSTGRAYLPAADMLPAQPGQHPQGKPGTFRVLIVAPRERQR
jgi:YVTN family beta-propeller protein